MLKDYMPANDIRTQPPTDAYRKGWDAIDWSKKPTPKEIKDDGLQPEQKHSP
jgi:hypothetical protein